MRTPEEYQNMAAQCAHLARAINDLDSKVMLLETAQTWIKLADYAAKTEQEESSPGLAHQPINRVIAELPKEG